MTTEHEATRTLVKSPPELWAECSDAGSLARHLGEFGEIQITRLEPETAVAWEGAHASGTVRIEPSGWGTRVTLTAQRRAEDIREEQHAPARVETPAVEAVADATPEPVADEATDQSTQEVSDATPEEAPEAENPALEADMGRIRWRWKRVSARLRGAFTRGEAEAEVEPAEVPEESVTSVAPPEPHAAPQDAPDEVVMSSDPPDEPVADEVDDEPEPEFDPEAILSAALDSLGQAHHRPFSRA